MTKETYIDCSDRDILPVFPPGLKPVMVESLNEFRKEPGCILARAAGDGMGTVIFDVVPAGPVGGEGETEDTSADPRLPKAERFHRRAVAVILPMSEFRKLCDGYRTRDAGR